MKFQENGKKDSRKIYPLEIAFEWFKILLLAVLVCSSLLLVLSMGELFCRWFFE